MLTSDSRAVPLNGEFLLVVDDDDAVTSSVTRFLAKNGYRTKRARNGIEAIELLQRESVVPSLVLIDLVMPRMGGLELMERLDRDHSFRDVPRVVMSGHDRLQRAPRARFLDFLIKPFDPDELLCLVRATSHTSCSRWAAASSDRQS